MREHAATHLVSQLPACLHLPNIVPLVEQLYYWFVRGQVEVSSALDMSMFAFGRAFKYALDCLGIKAPPPPMEAYVQRVASSLRALSQPPLRARVPLAA